MKANTIYPRDRRAGDGDRFLGVPPRPLSPQELYACDFYGYSATVFKPVQAGCPLTTRERHPQKSSFRKDVS